MRAVALLRVHKRGGHCVVIGQRRREERYKPSPTCFEVSEVLNMVCFLWLSFIHFVANFLAHSPYLWRALKFCYSPLL